MGDKCQWWVTKDAKSKSFEVTALIINDSGYGPKKAYMLPPSFHAGVDEGAIIPSAFSISKESAVGLLDELWGVGLRPTHWKESAPVPAAPTPADVEIAALKATIKALTDHLQDMRAITQSFLDLKK